VREEIKSTERIKRTIKKYKDGKGKEKKNKKG